MSKSELPMGWREVKGLSLKTDIGTPPEEWAETKYPDHPCKTIKAWVRGNAVVRIIELLLREDLELSEYSIQIESFLLKQDSTTLSSFVNLDCWDTQTQSVKSDEMKKAELLARNIMRLGGYPR